MLSCPVCRSQNMDTAKFCGNCGNPFPRPSMPTSSLINCPQGHVYSAVYQYCPYCPQPESAAAQEIPNDFATRIEEPATAFEPPNAYPVVAPMASSPNVAPDFSTNAEPFATNFETRVGSAQVFEPLNSPPEAFETKIGGIDLEEVLGQAAPQSLPPQASAPTEMISHLAETTIAEMPAITIESKPAPPAQTFPPPPPPPLAQAATVVSNDGLTSSHTQRDRLMPLLLLSTATTSDAPFWSPMKPGFSAPAKANWLVGWFLTTAIPMAKIFESMPVTTAWEPIRFATS